VDAQFKRMRNSRQIVFELAAGLFGRRGSMSKEGDKMSRGHRGYLGLVMALGLAISGLSFVETAFAIPFAGGPAIRDVTYDPGVLPGTADDYLDVIIDCAGLAFGVDATTVQLSDFVTTGSIDLTGTVPVVTSTTGASMVRFAAPTAAAVAGDSIRFSDDGVVASNAQPPYFPSAVLSMDRTPHPIHTGPIIWTAFFNAGEATSSPTDDVIRVVFNQDVQGSGGGAFNLNDFVLAALTGGESVPVPIGTQVVDISLDDLGPPTSGKLSPQNSTVRLVQDGTSLEDANGVLATSTVPCVIHCASPGPMIVDATYNDQGDITVDNDVLTLVFDRDLLQGVTAGFVSSDLDLSGTSLVLVAPTITILENVVEIEVGPGATAAGPAANETIDLIGGNTVTDRFGENNSSQAAIPITDGAGAFTGPIIVNAEYIAGDVFLQFSEPVTAASTATTDFVYNGQAAGTGIGSLADDDGDEFLTLELSSATWTDGDYVGLVAASVIGSVSGVTNASTVFSAIRLGEEPKGPPISIVNNLAETFEENPGGPTSIAHISWMETAGSDTADYYLLFTRVSDPVDSTYVADNYFRALPVHNPHTRFRPGASTVGPDRLIHGTIDISPGALTTEGTTIVAGDPIRFGIVAVLYDDVPAKITVSGTTGGLAPDLIMTAGPVLTPIDFIGGVDDDMVHIIGRKSPVADSLSGDGGSPGAVEPNARVLVFIDPAVTDTTDPSFIGSGIADIVGAFTPFQIGDNNQEATTGFIYIRAMDPWGNISPGALALINDIDMTGMVASDPFTPNQIYADGDSIVVRAVFRDTLFALTPILDNPADSIMAIADFSQIDTAPGSDNVPFLNDGADGVDNDGDWLPGVTNNVNEGNDVGLNGIPNDDDAGEMGGAGGGTPTPGEYFCDVGGPSGIGAGDGVYSSGEPFTDTNGNSLRDPGEPNIDQSDPQEAGVFSARWTINAATSVTDSGQVNFLDIKFLPVVITATDCFENMTVMDGTDPFNRFLIELDNLAPSVSEILTLEQEPGLLTNTGTNVVDPGDNCYPMGEFIDLTVTTPSDLDVDFVRLQISVNSGAFFDMSYDPNGDANGDGYPGAQGVDDDRDGLADSLDTQVLAAIDQVNGGPAAFDGVDNDNDGMIDESTTNGIDDNDDGTVDDGTEIETYNATLDDNEDGIEDGVNTAASGRALNPQPHVLDPDGLGVASGQTFDFFGTNGFNIDMRHIRNLYGISDNDSLRIRGVAYDLAGGPYYGPNTVNGQGTFSIIRNDQSGFNPTGNATPNYAAPICFTTNLVAPASDLVDSFLDTDPSTAGTQVCDAAENAQGGNSNVDETQQIPAIEAVYPLTATTADADVASMDFFVWNSSTLSWLLISTDVSPPFTSSFTPGLVDNDPAGRVNHFFLLTQSTDTFGNVEDFDKNGDTFVDSLDFDVELDVVDCVAPIVNVTRIGTDTDLNNGAIVPIQSNVEIEVGTSGFSDRDEIHMFTDGANGVPGAAGDDDGIGGADNRDFGFDGKPGTADDEWGRGDDIDMATLYAGFDGVFGTTDDGYVSRAGLGLDRGPGNRTVNDDGDGFTDEPDYGDDGFAGAGVGLNADEFLSAGSDDYFTNDVIRVDFEMRPVGGKGPWVTIQSITGTIVGGQVSDLIAPLVVTWDVTSLAAGDYDVRAQGFDIEGNSNDGPAFITTVSIQPVGLRAYILPPVTTGLAMFNLYANTYIHDILVDHVDFEFSTDGGTTWTFIGRDDNDLGSAGGDILLRQGTAPFNPNITGGVFNAFTVDVKFADLDGDGYSARDPIVNDANLNSVIDGGDFALIGSISGLSGEALTVFPADHFYVGALGVDPSDWIYQENANAGVFDLWTVAWDATGLSGDVLVRAVATNEIGVTDNEDTSPIPTESVTIDDTAPCATISGIQLPDGTFEAPQSDTLDVSATNSFVQVQATTADTDVDSVRFQWSSNGGATWEDGSVYFDVNEDNDFYSDIDGVPGFSSGDEIFFDADGNFSYSAADVVTKNQGITNPITPLGWDLKPLIGEDGVGGGDTDGDGLVDEDGVNATDGVISATSFFDVFFDLDGAAAAGLFATNTQVLLRAIAQDSDGNVCPNPTFFKALVHERRSCRVDAIVATATSGDTVDIFSTIADGDGGDQLGDDTLTVFATANDSTTIVDMRIYYRKNATGYPGLNIFNNPWVDAGLSDTDYPFFFTWDIGALPDGCYQFFVGCVDDGGNATLNNPPLYPYEFDKLTVTASIDSTTNINPSAAVDTVFPGDELTLYASLSDPAATASAEVTFKYAERILDEIVTLTPSFPNQYTLSSPAIPDGDGTFTSTVDVTVNGSAATYHTPSDFDALVAPTINDFTIVGGTVLKMGGAQSATDDILISYNVTAYRTILEGDRTSPYTVEWDFTTGGVPSPTVAGVSAFDLIASVSYNYFTPEFEGGGGQTPPGAQACLIETDLSEGRIIIVLNAKGPCPFVHGVNRDKSDNTYPFDYNDPGNPMCLTGDKQETGLAGKEIDVFVTVTDSAEAGIDSVFALVDGEATQYPFTLYSTSDSDASNDSISIPVTMYASDYAYHVNSDGIALSIEDIENVTLRYDDGSDQAQTMYDDGVNGGDQVAGDNCYTATPRLALGESYDYEFQIDLIGDDFEPELVADSRNNDGTGLIDENSTITIPSEFWYHHFDVGLDGVLDEGTHQMVVWAVDANGNRRSNVQCPQGRLMFIVDFTAPEFQMVGINPGVLHPCDLMLQGGNGGEECCLYTASAMLLPVSPSSTTVPDAQLGIDAVQWQFSPDNGIRWIRLGLDSSATGGWTLNGVWTWDPADDDVDNDGDGYFDEGDNVGDGQSEEEADFLLRAIVIDDCGSTNISEEITFRVDGKAPECDLVTPADGSLFPYGSTIQLCATSPDAGHLKSITFQYMDNSGEWFDIDWTPQDNDDPDYVPAPEANAAEVCITFDTNIVDLPGTNPFLWLRCVAADSACNEEEDPEPVLVQLYDATAPSAWISTFNSGCDEISAWDPKLAVSPDEVVITGVAVDPVNTSDIAKVTLERRVSAGVWEAIGVAYNENPPFTPITATQASFTITWDPTPYCGTTQVLRVTSTDTNNNTDSTNVTYNVPVDCTDPVVNYTTITFIDSTDTYENDQEVGSSVAVKPDPFTGDVAFRVITSSSDVSSMVVQYRLDDAANPGNWQTLEYCVPDLGTAPVGQPVGQGDCTDVTLDFEPNRSSTGAYFWWGVVPDWKHTVDLADGKYQFRVLANDYACNSNALSTDYVAATIDKTNPNCDFFGNDAVADGSIGQVAAGDPVTLRFVGSDNITDVEEVWYDWSFDGITWKRIDDDDQLSANNIDTDHASWSDDVVWNTPDYVVRDKDATIRAHFYDTAWDSTICTQSIRIEDKNAPVNTRIFDIASNNGSCDVYPRDPTETTIMVGTRIADEVVITAATAVGDSGIRQVTFEVSSDNGASWIVLGIDQDGSTFTNQYGMVMPIWSVVWDTEGLDTNGERLTPDGSYLLRAWAVDLEENYEVLTATTPMRAPIIVDNEAPIVRMNTVNTPDLDTNPSCDTNVERGTVAHVSGKTVADSIGAGATTETIDEDVDVTFWFMNAKDEPWVRDAWKVMNNANGIFFSPSPSASENPDENRPYSIDWDTARDQLPLTVGGTYNIVATGLDLNCNSGDPVMAWMSGLGTCFKVTDTTAPCATIVYLEREGGSDFRQWPDYERVNVIDELTAAILRGDTDTQRVDFYYRAQGSSTWILADGDLSVRDDYYDLHEWASDGLTEGIYEFAANGIDDAGNADFDPTNPNDPPCSITRLIIDRTAPVITAIAPIDSQTCRDVRYEYNFDDNDRQIDVIFTSPDRDILFENGDDNDEWIVFEWKYSDYPDVDNNWDDSGFDEILYDRSTNRFSTVFDVDEPEDDIVDFRVTVTDSAGNTTTQRLASWVVLDTNEPEVFITRIVNLTDDTTIDPADGGFDSDITAGDPVRFYVTARDNGSQYVPGWASCGVDSVFFEILRDDDDSDWMPLSIGIPAAGDTGVFYMDWNTTGVEAGDYQIRAFGTDCCGNVGYSDAVDLDVESNSLPKVAVVCFDPDVVNDITGQTLLHVYARDYCDQDVDKVIFEYRDLTGETSPWTVFGFTEEVTDTDSLWTSSINLSTTASFAVGDLVEFRATAIKYANDDGNRTIGLIDDAPAVTAVNIRRNPLGTRDLVIEPVRSNPHLVDFTMIELTPQTDDSWSLEVTTNAPATVPWVTVVAERNADQQQWEETVTLFRSPSNPLVWRGGATKEVIDALCDGGTVHFCLAALNNDIDAVLPLQVDIDERVVSAYKVTNAIGSNGPVSVYPLSGDSTRSLTVEIPRGNDTDGAVILSATLSPSIEENQDQSLFLTHVENTCYDIRAIECCYDCKAGKTPNESNVILSCFGEFDEAYPATISIRYNPEDLEAGQSEADLIPAWWDPSDDLFQITDIYDVVVDTTNNVVTFKSEDLCDQNIYCLVSPTGQQPIVAMLWPWCDNKYTNDRPVLRGTLTDIFTTGGEDDDSNGIDFTRIRIWFDNKLVGSTDFDDDDFGDDDDNDIITWALGNGTFNITDVSPANDIVAFKYTHSTLPEDRLAGGKHELKIQFFGADGNHGIWYEKKSSFWVDNTAPFVVMNGGTVGSPVLGNIAGYVNATEPALTARLFDQEAGVFARPTRQDPILDVLFGSFIGGPIVVTIPPIFGIGDSIRVTIDGVRFPVDDEMGLKMDVWLVDRADGQDDIDRYFERRLIQTGTADMLRYTPALSPVSGDTNTTYYDPSDTLTVRFPITADLSRYDGEEIEVVLYTAKVQHIGHDIQVPDPLFDDEENEEFTKYLLGAFDCAGNVGSQFTAARYIIDASAPKVAIVSPGCDAHLSAGSDLNIVIALSDQANRADVDNDGDGRFGEDGPDGIDNDGDWLGRVTIDGVVQYVDDTNRNGRPDAGEPHVDEDPNDATTFTGAGIDSSSVEIVINGPNGPVALDEDCETFSIQSGIIRCADGSPISIEGPHARGSYTITVSGSDRLGNQFSTSCSFQIEDEVLGVFAAEAFPNPFDNEGGNVTITWDQSRDARVTIEIFDFAGDFVARVRDNALMTPSQASQGIQWGGTASDGSILANGGYLAHIIVNDGARTRSTEVKIAVQHSAGK